MTVGGRVLATASILHVEHSVGLYIQSWAGTTGKKEKGRQWLSAASKKLMTVLHWLGLTVFILYIMNMLLEQNNTTGFSFATLTWAHIYQGLGNYSTLLYICFENRKTCMKHRRRPSKAGDAAVTRSRIHLRVHVLVNEPDVWTG